jgi:hypothetical protein
MVKGHAIRNEGSGVLNSSSLLWYYKDIIFTFFPFYLFGKESPVSPG